MSWDILKTAPKAIGIKQASKAIEKGTAQIVYIAADAEDKLTMPLKELCAKKNLTVEMVPDMSQLGKLCMIEVGAAAVAVLKQD
jgi:large subunit ribosomal protein L7A